MTQALRRTTATVLALLLSAGPVAAETPSQAVRAFEKACVERDEDTALAKIMQPGKMADLDAAFFNQKAERLVETSGEKGRKAEVATERIEGEVAAVTLLVHTGKDEDKKPHAEVIYLHKAGKHWRLIPFSNWRKLALTEGDKAALEKLEAWSEAEEERLSPPEKADWE